MALKDIIGRKALLASKDADVPVYSMDQVKNSKVLAEGKKPFLIKNRKKIVAEVVEPGGAYYECERCGEPTKNVIKYINRSNEWKKIILCDECEAELM